MKNDKLINEQIERLEDERATFLEDSQGQLKERHEGIEKLKISLRGQEEQLNRFVTQANIDIAKYDGGINELKKLVEKKMPKT